jgi:hypothetical protein
MADRGKPWEMVGSFDSITAAARKIIELEAYPITGIFLEILIETGAEAASEQEAFGHLEHTGKNGRSYVVKEIKH